MKEDLSAVLVAGGETTDLRHEERNIQTPAFELLNELGRDGWLCFDTHFSVANWSTQVNRWTTFWLRRELD